MLKFALLGNCFSDNLTEVKIWLHVYNNIACILT